MDQRCPLVNVWLTWIAVPLLALVVGLTSHWYFGIVGLAAALAMQLFYVRWFPRVSPLLGYGSVEDVAPQANAPAATVKEVTLYTASACPFCPILRPRLAALQQKLGFELHEIDVTFRPDIIRAKGLKSVPVVEANGRLLVGNATTQQLVAFLSGVQSAATAV